jgi:hypothetical protein
LGKISTLRDAIKKTFVTYSGPVYAANWIQPIQHCHPMRASVECTNWQTTYPTGNSGKKSTNRFGGTG